MIFKEIIYELNHPIYLKLVRSLIPHTDGLSGNALAQMVGVSRPRANQALRVLVSLGALSQRAVGKAFLYKICPEHTLVKQIFMPLLEFQKNIYANLGQLIAKHSKPHPVAIILYGSFARGEENPDSDIDIALIYPQKTNIPPENLESLITTIRKHYGNTLSVQILCKQQLFDGYKSGQPLITNIINEGLVLHGENILQKVRHGKNN